MIGKTLDDKCCWWASVLEPVEKVDFWRRWDACLHREYKQKKDFKIGKRLIGRVRKEAGRPLDQSSDVIIEVKGLTGCERS